MDRLIRFRELKVSIVTESVSVGGRRRGTISRSLSLSFHFSFSSFFFPFFLSFHLFARPQAKEPNSIINSEFLPEIWPWHCFSCRLSNAKAQKVSADSQPACRAVPVVRWPDQSLCEDTSWSFGVRGSCSVVVCLSRAAKWNHLFFFFLLSFELLCRKKLSGDNSVFSYCAWRRCSGEKLGILLQSLKRHNFSFFDNHCKYSH